MSENHTEDADQVKVEVRQFHMGLIVHLTVYAPSTASGRRACRSAFERLAELDQETLSNYRPDSEVQKLSRLPGSGPVTLSPELYEVLAAACRLAEETEGRFDPTAGPVLDLWRQARRRQALPDPVALREAGLAVDHRRLQLDPTTRSLSWTGPAPALDLGAIAKGFIGDQVLARLRELGIPRAQFEAGGDLVLGDPPPGRTGWPVELPEWEGGVAELARCAISISGDASQHLEVEGVRYSHVVDARTGQALTGGGSCVVIAPTGIQSDALATAGTLVEPQALRDLLLRYGPECRAWFRPRGPETPDSPPGSSP